MQNEETQPQNQLNPDEARASLGIATRLSEQFFNPKQAPQDQQNATQQEPTQEPDKTPSADNGALKEEIMKDVKDTIKSELSSFKDELKQALENDGE